MNHWIKCPHCGEKRNLSNAYTSPANCARDAEHWEYYHESGRCMEAEED